MLALRPNCECCDRDLPPGSRDAMICSFECTFCKSLRRGRAEGALSELRRRTGAAARSSRRQAGEVSGIDRAEGEGRRVCGGLKTGARMPLRPITGGENANDARRRENVHDAARACDLFHVTVLAPAQEMRTTSRERRRHPAATTRAVRQILDRHVVCSLLTAIEPFCLQERGPFRSTRGTRCLSSAPISRRMNSRRPGGIRSRGDGRRREPSPHRGKTTPV